ncbi:MAG: transcription-repair coupling factor, partial [Deltaproteobacteria bacterium]|nr:transcription-repair coupling factor [Deltaproteobacteria bacterium]
GEEVDRDRVLSRLVDRGYFSTDLCSEPGTFAVRGGILDIFAPSYPLPLRIDFWGDEIESIRTFDPHTSRSRETLQRAVLLPIREEVVTDGALRRLPSRLKELADARRVIPRKRIQIQDELKESRLVQEIELYLPLLRSEPLVPVLDYLRQPGALLVHQSPTAVATALYGEADQIQQRYEREGGAERLLPEPGTLWLDGDQLDAATSSLRRIVLPDVTEDIPKGDQLLRLEAPDHSGLRAELLARRTNEAGMLEPLAQRVRRWKKENLAVLIVCRSRRRARQLTELLRPYEIAVREHAEPPPLEDLLEASSELRVGRFVEVVQGDLERGFSLPSAGVVALSEVEIFGRKATARRKQKRLQGAEAIGSFAQLSPQDVVVHSLHGIGRFVGMTKIQLDPSALDIKQAQRERAADPTYVPGTGGKAGADRGSHNDYLLLTYRGGDRLYLPVHKLDQLSRYVAPGGGEPKLDKLGGTTWARRRKKASEAAQKVARELLDLYAKRQMARSHAYPPPDVLYREFADGFEYEETPDQQSAIDAVLEDMSSAKPMDRLVVGDVGFGKTEVAMRAAFRAIEDGKQVAVLVPTTILALQHTRAFQERMAAFPVRIEMLSRFKTAAQQRAILKDVKSGRVDVVVGTHRLVSKDVSFSDLGLVVVDEEHRFGVKHKERLKELRAAVDVLTLTATPIPRTLNLAFAGIRDFSIIATPPEGRRPVRTQVVRFAPRRIVDAVQREVDRGGQVYFVHNRVKTIHKMAELLHKLLPDVQVRVAHGQMGERQLEDIMVSFFKREFDVLLCTTIIESGIDLPTANTMIINRADMMGLAQMHQLRGRVGRGLEQGYCLLLVPPGRTVRSEALARLKVLQDHSDLGAGHQIAQHDLELRGAGNMLGKRQAGHVADVGLSTYMNLLETAVKRLKGERVDDGLDPEIELRADAYIPADYIPDEAERLLEYKTLADARTEEELQKALHELEDTFGPAPPEVRRFEQLIEVKVLARTLRIGRLRTVRGGRLQLTIEEGTPLDPMRLMKLVARAPKRYSFRQDGVLHVHLGDEDRSDLVVTSLRLLKRLMKLVDPPGKVEAPSAV